MPIVGATVIDVANEYRRRVAALPIQFAFALYDHTRNALVFTTFLQDVDHEAEDELARIEAYMVDSFSEYLLDFRTIHLMGRDLRGFIPANAFPLIQRTSEPAAH